MYEMYENFVLYGGADGFFICSTCNSRCLCQMVYTKIIWARVLQWPKCGALVPTQSWFSFLLEMSVDHALRLPVSPKLGSVKNFPTRSWDLNARWSIFCAWCKSKERNPLKASTPLIPYFLEYFSKQRNRTIEGYKTAIADFLRFHNQENFNENISQQTHQKFQVRSPKTKECLPKVELGYDPQLPFLNQPLLEPSSEAELKFLTWKMVFLVTMALAARFSEVHALSFAELGFEDNYKFAVLSTIPEFQPETNRWQAFMKIPTLGPLVRGLDEEMMLCPVHT